MRYEAGVREINSGRFAFFMGAALIGELLGALSVTLSSSPVGRIACSDPTSLSYAVSSFLGTSIYMAAAFLIGFFPIGQPLALAVMLIHGMGEGALLTDSYAAYGLSRVADTAASLVFRSVVTSAALAFGCIESVTLSSAYLRHTLSDRQVLGMKGTVRAYVIMFLKLEALCALASGVQLLINCIKR